MLSWCFCYFASYLCNAKEKTVSSSSSISVSSAAVASALSPLLEPNLDKLTAIFQVVIPPDSTPEDKLQLCFKAVIQACKNGKWVLINRAAEALRGLRDKKERSVFFALVKKAEDENTIKSILDNHLQEILASGDFSKALHEAIRLNKNYLVPLLWEHIHQNQQGVADKTPLHIAIETGLVDRLAELIVNGASLSVTFNFNGIPMSPAAWAVAHGQIECFDLLVLKQPHFPWLEKVGNIGNLLHVAIHFGQVALLEHVLTHFVVDTQELLEERNDEGLPPLLYAAARDEQEAIRALDRRKVDLNCTDRVTRTALHWAMLKGHRGSVRLLLLLGADPEWNDKDFKRPEDVAADPTLRAFLSNVIDQKRLGRLAPPNFRREPPENLIFTGGGAKGIAYIGSLRFLEEQNLLQKLSRAAGTSAGAFTATLVSLGKDSLEIEKIIDKYPLTSFLDPKNLLEGDAWTVAKNIFNLIRTILNPIKLFQALYGFTGYCEGEKLRLWIEEMISTATGITHCTFGEFRKLILEGKPFKHLHVVSTRIGEHPQIVHFNSEDEMWDEFIISDCVRLSMMIPAVFKPHSPFCKINGIRTEVKGLGSFVDGGLLCNFPLGEFDFAGYTRRGLKAEERKYPLFNRRTLGFTFQTPNAPSESPPVNNTIDFLKGMMMAYYNAETLIRQMSTYNKHRVIEIDSLGIGTLELDLTPEQKEELIKKAESDTRKFFKDEAIGVDSFFIPVPSKMHQGLINLKAPLKVAFVRPVEFFRGLNHALIPMVHSPQDQTRVRILWGPEGSDTNEVAYTFARNERHSFSLIACIQCDTNEALSDSYRALARALEISLGDDSTLDTLKPVVHAQLENFTASKLYSNKPWLLIFEGILDIPTFPLRGGAVLCTSKKKLGSKEQQVELPPIASKESITYLKEVTHQADERQFSFLAEHLAYLPLPLALAASYLAETKKEVAPYLTSCYDLNMSPIKKVLHLTYIHLAKEQPKAVAWLHTLAHLNGMRIPKKWAGKVLWGPLHKFHLVRQDGENYSIHPAIIDFMLSMQTNEEKNEFFKKAFELIETDEMHSDVELWLLHASTVVKNPCYASLPDAIRASTWYALGALRQRFVSAKIALNDFYEAVKISEGLKLAQALSQTAIILSLLKRYEECLPLAKQALDALEKTADPALRTEVCYAEGEAFLAIGNKTKALASFLEVYAHGTSPLPLVVKIASLYLDLGHYSEAYAKYKEALEVMRKKQASVEHADFLYHLGLAAKGAGKPEEALANFQEALSIYPKNHPKVVSVKKLIDELNPNNCSLQ